MAKRVATSQFLAGKFASRSSSNAPGGIFVKDRSFGLVDYASRLQPLRGQMQVCGVQGGVINVVFSLSWAGNDSISWYSGALIQAGELSSVRSHADYFCITFTCPQMGSNKKVRPNPRANLWTGGGAGTEACARRVHLSWCPQGAFFGSQREETIHLEGALFGYAVPSKHGDGRPQNRGARHVYIYIYIYS